MNMMTVCHCHAAAVLDGKIFVVGGLCDRHRPRQSSMECVDVHDIIECAPLDCPPPARIFNQIL